MNIDKSKLRMGIWYEDEQGNRIDSDSSCIDPPKNAVTYHTLFPLEVQENVYGYYRNKDTCKHPLKYRKRTGGWIDGIKGCECERCGKEKVGKKYIPFFLMHWSDGKSSYKMFTSSTHIGAGCEDVILAMANSGDYTLSEAIAVYANACERCANVLTYKYLNGKDGYKEFSEDRKKTNTVCDFCKEVR